ncbi:MAG: gamma-glutamyl-gamma-aminobutyrate hydrolase family protein [Anaerolineae bacterium]|nr:gamma-glutamyl-gamma-aminobutyrate hydrolase family protein [Anaerolineae bacterium]
MGLVPLVAVTTSNYIREKTGVPNHLLPQAYTRALLACGVMPVLVPSTHNIHALRSLYERVDGILISGGGDVNPRFSGLESCDLVYGVEDARDETELSLVRWAHEDDKPLLGICRGQQVINVALGGTLIMDIPTETGSTVTHMVGTAAHQRKMLLHTVELAADSRISTMLGTGSLEVNSIHHQGIKNLGNHLRAFATAPDGIIEGIEIPDACFFVGVQWHPEELFDFSPPMQMLFQQFAEAVCR